MKTGPLSCSGRRRMRRWGGRTEASFGKLRTGLVGRSTTADSSFVRMTFSWERMKTGPLSCSEPVKQSPKPVERVLVARRGGGGQAPALRKNHKLSGSRRMRRWGRRTEASFGKLRTGLVGRSTTPDSSFVRMTFSWERGSGLGLPAAGLTPGNERTRLRAHHRGR